jgi:hypothetical protein
MADEALRLVALRLIHKPDREFFLRRVMRWYSKTFHTPLERVEEIPTDDLLRVWYEEQYLAMSPDDLERERVDLLTTSQQRYEQILTECADEAEMFVTSQVIAAEEARAKLEAKKAKEQKIAEPQAKSGPIRPVTMPETDLPRVSSNVPPDITMNFMDEKSFEAELNGFGAMGQPTKP